MQKFVLYLIHVVIMRDLFLTEIKEYNICIRFVFVERYHCSRLLYTEN